MSRSLKVHPVCGSGAHHGVEWCWDQNPVVDDAQLCSISVVTKLVWLHRQHAIQGLAEDEDEGSNYALVGQEVVVGDDSTDAFYSLCVPVSAAVGQRTLWQSHSAN